MSNFFSAWILFIFLLFFVLIDYTPKDMIIGPEQWVESYDQTDDMENLKHSGLNIYVDYGTNLQYISTYRGGLTPRLNKDGKHMVYSPKKKKE